MGKSTCYKLKKHTTCVCALTLGVSKNRAPQHPVVYHHFPISAHKYSIYKNRYESYQYMLVLYRETYHFISYYIPIISSLYPPIMVFVCPCPPRRYRWKLSTSDQIWTFQWPGCCRDMKQNMWASENQKYHNVCVYSA
jgi:hypothetical protein